MSLLNKKVTVQEFYKRDDSPKPSWQGTATDRRDGVKCAGSVEYLVQPDARYTFAGVKPYEAPRGRWIAERFLMVQQ